MLPYTVISNTFVIEWLNYYTLTQQMTQTIPLSLTYYVVFQEFYSPTVYNGAHCVNIKESNQITVMNWNNGSGAITEHYTMDVLIVGY